MEVRDLAWYLRDLTELLDPGAGWCGLFWRRDPGGMRACLDGAEVPPWDVLEALLQDLAPAAGHGVDAAGRGTGQVRALHAAAAAAHDRRPGGREVLAERLTAVRGQWAHAARREAELAERGDPQAPGLDAELAWVRDDLERAAARCGELGARLAALDGGPDGPQPRFSTREALLPHPAASRSPRLPDGLQCPDADAPDIPGLRPGPRSANAGEADNVRRARGAGTHPEAPEPAAGASRKRRPRGARYAGMEADAGDTGAVLPSAAVSAPRGARFAGAEEPEAPPVAVPGEDPDAVALAVSHAVAALARLRAQGRTGEAHALLCEAASWPPARLPVLADALHHVGLGADWATLLWEAASLPLDQVAAAAGALDAAGLAEDGRQLRRQGVARPAVAVAAALLALDETGRPHEVRALADAFVRVRTPEDAALATLSDPRRLSPLLLEAARQVSRGRYHDVVHALRVAGAAP
ncbi:hypothetical protein [Streptomyces hypolithicus]